MKKVSILYSIIKTMTYICKVKTANGSVRD